MASITQASSRIQRAPASCDDLYVPEGVELIVTRSAIVDAPAAGDRTVVVDGTVASFNAAAISLGAGAAYSEVVVGATGVVRGLSGISSAIDVSLEGDDDRLDNHGMIAGGHAVSGADTVTIESRGTFSATIANAVSLHQVAGLQMLDGRLIAGSDGIVILGGCQGALSNAGSILSSGADGIGVEIQDSVLAIDDTGLIQGRPCAIRATGDVADDVRSAGTLQGPVDVGGGSAQATNSGEITGRDGLRAALGDAATRRRCRTRGPSCGPCRRESRSPPWRRSSSPTPAGSPAGGCRC